MTDAEKRYHEITDTLPNITKSKMFGALCVKAPNGKAGIMFWKDYMVFKLTGEAEKEALSLDGAKVFTPMDNRPMNGWIQVPYEYAAKWKTLAEQAMQYVAAIEEKPKKKAK